MSDIVKDNLPPGDPDGLLPEEPDNAEPWRPVWEDEAEAAAAVPVPPWTTPFQARSLLLRRGAPDPTALLGPLAAAEDAGWLATAADRTWVHPHDLALAEAGLLGSFAAAALAGRPAHALPATSTALGGGPGRAGGAGASAAGAEALAAEADRLPDGPVLAQGLALAWTLRRLETTGWDPLASQEATAAALAPLAAERDGLAPLRLRPERFGVWRQGALAGPRKGEVMGHPALLAAAAAGAAWMGAGALEDAPPTPAQALLLAAAVARRRGRVRAVPPVLLGQPRAAGAAAGGAAAVRPGGLAGRLPRAGRRGGAVRPGQAGPPARRRGRRSAGRRRSLLPAAAEAARLAPALTARGLARRLGVTPQGALLLLRRLEEAGVVREATGRQSFRAWVA